MQIRIRKRWNSTGRFEWFEVEYRSWRWLSWVGLTRPGGAFTATFDSLDAARTAAQQLEDGTWWTAVHPDQIIEVHP